MWVEVDVFRGRTYVNQQWGSAGVLVGDDGSDAELGEAVLDQLARPEVPVPLHGAPAGWHLFTENVAGVPAEQYRPEKRVRVWTAGGDWRVDAKPRDPDAPVRPVTAAEGPAGLGAAVRRELAAMEPRWPSTGCAVLLTTATGQFAVMPKVHASA